MKQSTERQFISKLLSATHPWNSTALPIGIDVGSTTVKAVVVDPTSWDIIWSDYQRHHTRQAEAVLNCLLAIRERFPNLEWERCPVYLTGSGASPLVTPMGARFVQEVNAVTLAIEQLHPDVRSVVELGGQDAKIVLFKVDDAGNIRSEATMNDKCASGTGATIDKCLLKVGMPPERLVDIDPDGATLHNIAAKCGVFAESDVVSLIKSGVPAEEIIYSLGDAVVRQNLSVLARGNTLRPQVLLLGGPNVYLPFLRRCWQRRIIETWNERGLDVQTGAPLDELISVPENALLYAAYGSVLFGRQETGETVTFRGPDSLEAYIRHDRAERLAAHAGPSLVGSDHELKTFRERYQPPMFVPPSFIPGEKVRGAIGVDGGSTSTKAVLLDEDGHVLRKVYKLSQGNPIHEAKSLLGQILDDVEEQGAQLEVLGFGATGYAADVLEKILHADVNIVETVAHMNSAVRFFGETDVICDVGGQDIKVLFLQNGELRNFRLSNQCSAGNGMLLQAMANQFGVNVENYAENAFQASLTPLFSYGCAVFLDSDRVNFQREGFNREELMAGLAMVLPKNIWQYVVQISRMSELGSRYVLQGGTQYNLAAVKAQVDYIVERVPDAQIDLHPHPGEAGAIGAALEALRIVKQRGRSTFIGMEQALGLDFTARSDEATRCTFCQNHCPRTFIDSRTPNGTTARYISGFSCDRGTVENIEALKILNRERRKRMNRYPNLAAHESKRLFAHTYDSNPLPSEDTVIDAIEVRKGLLGGVKRKAVRRPFHRSSPSVAERHADLRIGMPRCLDMWSSAPFWRTYFETLGISPRNIVWSDESSESMFAEGGKYGSVDPCYPAKVAQAHIHNLLFQHHSDAKPLRYIFFPTVTQIPTFLEGLAGATACPVVSGTPNVLKAAFTKEVDYFSTRGIEYLDAAFCANEPVLAKQQLVDMWCARLGVTEDESDFAYEQGNKAMAAFDREMEEMGLQVLTRAERDHRICLLVLCRPYHLDRGLNHGVLEDFQALGYPVLTLRSLPKKPAWLERFFRDAKGEACPNPLDIGDVWRESNNSNSALKVWGAKFAARHPNVAILDLSSFKCGHDAPIYGIVDNIVNTAHAPYSALHDIDANKPSGSIKIRVKTYAHSLRRRQEQLEARAASQGFTHRPPLATQHSSQWGDITRLDSSPTVSVPIVEPQPV